MTRLRRKVSYTEVALLCGDKIGVDAIIEDHLAVQGTELDRSVVVRFCTRDANCEEELPSTLINYFLDLLARIMTSPTS